MQKTLFLMMGYPGAGKTTAAKIIEKLTGAVHVWADKTRREVHQTPSYSHQENLAIYAQLNQQTRQYLENDSSVIYDTNFSYYKDRQHLKSIATEQDARTIVIAVKTPVHVAKQRAVVDAHLHQHTRVLGHMQADKFEKLASSIEEPHPDEVVIVLDGTKLNEDYVKDQLRTANVL